MKLYCGIDLHSNNSVVAVIDEEDKVLYRKRLPNDLRVILIELEAYKKKLAGIVVESTYNWYWLVDGLMNEGYKVHLANTAAIKQYEGLKYADDDHDARHLAHLLRLGILPEGHIYPCEERAVRDLFRKRLFLVRQRVTHILSFENVIARNTGSLMSSSMIKRSSQKDIETMPLLAPVKTGLNAHLTIINALNEQIEQIEEAVQGYLRKSEELRMLKTAPGIGDILATTICLEAGQVSRFAKVGNFSSYSRCVDSLHLSNGKKKGEGNVKNGNKYLAWAFIEAANYAIRYCPQAKAFYQRKKAKTNGIVAIKATAHKLARACYYVMKDKVPFEVNKCFS